MANTVDVERPDARNTLAALFRRIKAHWREVLVLLCLGTLIGWGWALLEPRRYTASATGLVSTGPTSNIGVGLAADSFAKSKATQYQTLATSPVVVARAREIAGAQPTTSVIWQVPLETAQITVRVTGPIPRDVQKMANAQITALAEAIDDLENQRVPGGAPSSEPSQSVVKLMTLSPAGLPVAPSWPPRTVALLAGALVGLVFAALYVAVRAIFDRRISSIQIVEDSLGISVVGTLPLRTNADGGSRLAHHGSQDRRSDRDFPTAEAFKELRTNLQFMRPDSPLRTIVVTSAVPGEGKSTIALNLAASIASTGREVVLVDGDLRRPTVATTLSLVGEVGVTDVVVGRLSLSEALQSHTDWPSLRVLTAGSHVPNPAEIIASRSFETMITDLAREAMVIIDAPPLLPVTDAAIMASTFDGCLLVAHAGRTTIDELTKARRNVITANGTVLGLVLNRVPRKKSAAARYSYYGSHYGYYRRSPEESALAHADVDGSPSG